MPSVSELCVLCGKKLIDKVYEGILKFSVLLPTGPPDKIPGFGNITSEILGNRLFGLIYAKSVGFFGHIQSISTAWATPHFGIFIAFPH